MSEDFAATGDLHHLGDPVAGGVRWLEPLGDEHRSRRRAGHAPADGRDLRLHLGDDGASSCRYAEQVSERENALFDLGECARVEGDDLGVRCAQLTEVVGGDGADRAEVLGQDQVGLERLEQVAVDRVQGASVADRFAHRLVDLEAGQAGRVDARGGDDREVVNVGWPVALLRDADE